MDQQGRSATSSCAPWTVAWLLAGLMASSALGHEGRNLRFDRLSLEQGLSQSAINAILQDRQGFMWFGTEDGLNRFDGYRFTVYKNRPRDPASLSSDFVWAIVEDRRGDLWIGTNGGGLSRWHAAEERFSTFRHEPGNPNSLAHDRVRALLEDREARLWVGTDGAGLSRYDPARDVWRHFRHDPADPDSLSNDRIRALLEDSAGNLWVGTYGGGLERYDAASGRFVHHRPDPRDTDAGPSDDFIYTIFEDSDGTIWIGTYTGGLNRLDRAGGRFTHFRHDPGDPRSLAAGRVRAVFQDRDGLLWVGTDGGLNEWLGPDRGFVRHGHHPGDPRSLSDDKVTVIHQDRGGVLWVGTKSDGLNKWNPSTGSFALHRVDTLAPSSLSSNAVASFQDDPASNVLWIGTFGGGLNRLDRETDHYTVFRNDPAKPSSLSDDRVMSLLLDRDRILWVGTYEGGLNRMDPATNRFRRFLHDPSDPTSISGNAVTAIYEDHQRNLWIGTFEGGLNRLDRATGRFVRYVHDPNDPQSVGSNRVTAFCEDGDGVLWVGTDGGGLNRFDRRKGTFARFRHDSEDPASLSSDVVYTIHEDGDGVLWIGTQGGGLNRWDLRNRRDGRAVFKRYTEEEGLPNNLVYGILSDHENHLWMSTNRGLTKFDPRGETFKTYDTSHGLQSNEFNFGAYHRSADGEMFFGGIKGYNSFYPSEIRDNEHVPPVVLTSFLKLNREVALDRPLTRVEEIVLDYTDYIVSFEFAALDFAAPEKNRYAYKLQGFDADWIELGTTRRATYTNLDAGNYVLRVKGSNNDDAWNEEAIAVRVRVLPPPWKTWWAYTLYGMTLLGVVLAYTRSQAKKLEREAEYSRKLEREVHARTRELAARNDDLQEANRKLQEASLTDQLTGLRNRRYLMTEIDKAIALTERYYHSGGRDHTRSPAEADFLFLMIDLDGLKGINDTRGHMAGDRALLQMRDLLHETCRKSDTIIRWGGDEFLVVGRNMSVNSGEQLAERLRAAVVEHEFDLGSNQKVRLSCSIGFAKYPFLPHVPTHVNWEQVVTIADRALYIAKKSGRNAWVGILGTEKTPEQNLVPLVQEHTEQLVSTGAIQIRTSLAKPHALVWTHS